MAGVTGGCGAGGVRVASRESPSLPAAGAPAGGSLWVCVKWYTRPARVLYLAPHTVGEKVTYVSLMLLEKFQYGSIM